MKRLNSSSLELFEREIRDERKRIDRKRNFRKPI